MFNTILSWLRPTRTGREEKTSLPRVRLEVGVLEDRTCPAITFQFDYSLDTSGFFTADRKQAIADAGADMGRYLATTLTAITPSGSNTWMESFFDPIAGTGNITQAGSTIAANTMKVYVGSRNYTDGTLAAAAYGRVASANGLDPFKRGNTGFQSAYSAWGGSMAIDSVLDNATWYTGSGTPGTDQVDLRTVVRHELGHILGYGVIGFAGNTSAFANDGTAPPLSPDSGHWAAGTKWDSTDALMVPGTDAGPLSIRGATGLDYAGLKDVGWKVAVAIGTPSADTIILTKLAGTTYRATITNSSNIQLQYEFDGSGGILVLGGAGNDLIGVDNSATTNLVSVSGGSGSDALVTRGTAGTDIATLTAATSATLGFVQVGAVTNRVYFDTGVEQVNYESNGGGDVAYATAGTTTNFYALRTGGGALTLVVRGTTGTDIATLTSAPAGSGYGSVSLGGVYVPVRFDNSVVQVNYESNGGGDVAYANLGTTTTFVTARTGGGALTLVVRGTTGSDIAIILTAAPAGGGYGSVSLGGAYKSVLFDNTVAQVNYESNGGGDQAYATTGTTTTFVTARTGGGSLILGTYGTSGNDNATLTAATAGVYGTVSLGGAYKAVLFDANVDQVNFDGGDGNDTLYVDNTGSTKKFVFIGGNGIDTLRYRTGWLTYIDRYGVESEVQY